MPRESSDNTAAINMKVPPAWIERADKLAAAEKGLGRLTRTDVLRAALERGLEVLEKERRGSKKKG
jgi:hypothetical protein